MAPPHGVQLTDTGEHDAVEDATPDELEGMANQSASKLFVVNMCKLCWVKRWVRGVRLKWAFVLGFIVAVQAIGVLAVRSITETAVRKTVIEVLKERQLITADEAKAERPLQLIPSALAQGKATQ
jgi:hypothetical protein